MRLPYSVQGRSDSLISPMQLAPGDDAYPHCWRSIKARFSEAVSDDVVPTASRLRRGERGVWQRRYWEHRIRDNNDYRRHLDNLHYDPVKHGRAAMTKD